ncbi:hypothetical protein Amsp01_022970 [Amycolatopsis sp. NBRC 101858]|uniref:hypothetical protein n=1 Tax=Amycolatopsis sp. NBRC 101858 TaxID=3032200 RepID=UPI0024A169D7|nr:hypothetical protein [Amycolatopsis sp. NBRC 101858]GLY36273.1 hypothetical protein Amsp01_022970 [Amycolatopsis sp. NBRC 101858]
MTVAALVVSVCALTFTITSFWWLNARTGRLRSFAPHTFAAIRTANQESVCLPLVIQNTGPRPIAVQDLRLVLLREPDGRHLPWARTRDRLEYPGERRAAELPAAFPVSGLDAKQVFIEFDSSSPTLGSLDHLVRVEVKTGHRARWRRLVAFTLHASAIVHPGQFIAYSNKPPSE